MVETILKTIQTGNHKNRRREVTFERNTLLRLKWRILLNSLNRRRCKKYVAHYSRVTSITSVLTERSTQTLGLAAVETMDMVRQRYVSQFVPDRWSYVLRCNHIAWIKRAEDHACLNWFGYNFIILYGLCYKVHKKPNNNAIGSTRIFRQYALRLLLL